MNTPCFVRLENGFSFNMANAVMIHDHDGVISVDTNQPENSTDEAGRPIVQSANYTFRGKDADAIRAWLLRYSVGI